MRKLPTASIDLRPRSRRSRAVAMVLIPLFIAVSPVLYESTILVVAGWQGLFGSYPHTNTPILDALGNVYQTASFDTKVWVHGFFNRTPWRSSFVIPFAIFWTAVLAMLLRKC